MSDNVVADAGSGGSTFATDDIGGVHYPRTKVCWGANNTATDTADATNERLPVKVGDALPAGTNNIGDVDVLTVPAPLSTSGGGTEATALRVTLANDSTGVLSVDDNGGSLTVDGTVAVSGTVTVGSHAVTNAGTFATQVDGAALTALQLIDNIVRTEDEASGDGHSGAVILARRTATPANTSGADLDYEVPQMNAGRLWVSATVDAALPAGTANIGDVDVASIAAGDNNIGNVDVVTLPALPAGTNNIGDVDVLSVVPGTGATALGKAIDAASGATDTGVAPLAIRDDALSTLTPVEGDYVPLRVNSTGALHVTGGGGGTQYAVDDAAGATPTGTVALVVRKDSAASLAGTDGDVTALQVDSAGALRVTGGGGGTEYVVNAVAPADPTGATFVMERDDALSALSEVEGDWTNPRSNANGALWTAVNGTVTVDGSGVTQPVSGTVSANAGTGFPAVVTEDAAASGGETGIQVLGVRRDADTSPVSASGDFHSLIFDDLGNLKCIFKGSLPPGTNLIGEVMGDTAHDGAIAGGSNPVLQGGYASAAAPTDVSADGDAVNAWRLRNGAAATVITAAGALIGGDATNGLDTDVTRVIPGTSATHLGKAEDAAHSSGDTGVYALAVRDDSPAAHSGTDGDYESLHVNAEGGLWTTPTPSASGGLSIFRSLDLDESEEDVKTAAGTVYSAWITNTATSTRWVKFYNATAANVTVGTTTPVITIGIPGNTTDDISAHFAAGGHGIAFGTAISVAATTGVADADTGAPAANEVIVNIFYK